MAFETAVSHRRQRPGIDTSGCRPCMLLLAERRRSAARNGVKPVNDKMYILRQPFPLHGLVFYDRHSVSRDAVLAASVDPRL